MAEISITIDTDGVTGDYSSLVLAEAGEQTDLVSAGDNIVFNCQATTGVADTTPVTFIGWATGDGNDIKIIGNQTTGIYNTSFYHMEVDNGIIIAESYVAISKLQVEVTQDSTYDTGINIQTGAYTNIVISYNIIQYTNPTGTYHKGINVSNNASITAEIFNNVVYSLSATIAGNGIFVEDGTVNVYNNTVYGFADGIELETGATVGLYNNAVFNCTDDIDPGGATITSNYNATEEGYGTNAVTITQTASDFAALVTDAANGDFTITDDSSELYNAGTNTGAPSDDIIGTSRPQATTVDIGAFEFIVGGATPQAVTGNMPAATGILTTIIVVQQAIVGDMPNATGILIKNSFINLVGIMPAAAGVIIKGVTAHLLGNMPSSFGTLIKHITTAIKGEMDAPSGEVTESFSTSQSVDGDMPNATGILSTILNPVVSATKNLIKIIGSAFKRLI